MTVPAASIHAKVRTLPAARLRLVVMGVSGCGKSTLAQALAQTLGWTYVEGDQYHPSANIAKMSAGQPLDDSDRAGWLDRLSELITQARQAQQGLVLTCSALKQRYRERLRMADSDLRFVHLSGDANTIAQRLQARQGHYMPASLLQSQLQTLEPPSAHEPALVLDLALPPDQLVHRTLAHWHLHGDEGLT